MPTLQNDGPTEVRFDPPIVSSDGAEGRIQRVRGYTVSPIAHVLPHSPIFFFFLQKLFPSPSLCPSAYVHRDGEGKEKKERRRDLQRCCMMSDVVIEASLIHRHYPTQTRE
eukprot:TRINITY_DN2459_c0_g2_i1.p2 TRINITY_DN2459_c0_g2~~TRINITY_DN2459_c0_g2_i1.p2  ORF type:complete len:111 (-),score=9.56 TRINITY_DN2459_c0_g2_i1:403-735(-)